MKHRLTSAYLLLAGLLLLAVGGTILLAPQALHAGNGIVLGNEPSLLSEIRAPGGLLVGCAVLILLGVFRPGLRVSAKRLAVLVYGTFGLARLLGLALDGVPATGILAATLIELALAAIGFWMLRRPSDTASSAFDRHPAMAPDTR